MEVGYSAAGMGRVIFWNIQRSVDYLIIRVIDQSRKVTDLFVAALYAEHRMMPDQASDAAQHAGD